MAWRKVLAVGSLLATLAILGYAAGTWEGVRVLRDRDFNDLIKAGIQLKIEQSRSEFQLALLLLGGLWTLVIAKKDEASLILSDAQELCMFICANLLLLASCGCHFWYVAYVADAYSIAGAIKGGTTIPDVLSSGIDDPYKFQLLFIVGGAVVAGAALFSAHKLK